MVIGIDDAIFAFAASKLSSVAYTGASGLLGPAKRGIEQSANIVTPNSAPPFPMLVEAYNQLRLTREQLDHACLPLGITINGPSYGWYWNKVVESMKPAAPMSALGQMYAGDLISLTTLRDNLKRSGIVDDEAWQVISESFGAPPWKWVLEQRRLGQLSDDMWSMLCRVHAIGKDNYKELWETSTSPLAVDTALDLWLRGLLNSDRTSQHIAASGVIANPDNAALFTRALNSGIPDMHTLLQQMRLGVMDFDEYQELTNLAGYSSNKSRVLAQRQTVVLPTTQIFELLNRGLINADRAERHMVAGGFTNSSDRQAVDKLRYHNPQVVEVVRYQRAADANASALNKLKLHTEYPDSVAQAAERTGWNQDTITIGTNEAGPVNTSPAKAEWIAHWAMPNPNEAVRMKIFLTEHRVSQLREIGLNVERISDDELNGLLQGAAIPPGWRDYVKASAYKQIPLREIVRVARFTKLEHFELVDRFVQLGYVPEDAERISRGIEEYIKNLENHKVNAEVDKVFHEKVKAAKEGFEVGYLSLETAAKTLVGIGFTQAQALDVLNLVSYDRNHRMAVAGVKAIEQAFSRGELNAAGVITALTKIGIVNTAAQLYLRQWQLTHTTHLKHASTTEILRWLEEGILTPANAELRLANLGWTNADILALVADARRVQAKLTAQATAAQAKDRKQRANALLSVAKQADATRKAAISGLRKAAGIKTLVKWWIDGVLTEAQIEERGQLIGYTLADIHNYMNDALITQSAKAERKANAKAAKVAAAIP